MTYNSEVPMFTTRFKAVSDLDKTLNGRRRGFVPVRTSLGRPRWIGESSQWPYMASLAPYGLRQVEDFNEFMARYRQRLDKIGVEQIADELTRIWECQTEGSWMSTPEAGRLPLALLCFEDVDQAGQWCHRRMFAAWWLEQTGQAIEERNTADLLPILEPAHNAQT